jgi:hypothetical protein
MAARIVAGLTFWCFFIPYAFGRELSYAAFLFIFPAFVLIVPAIVLALFKTDAKALAWAVAGPALFWAPLLAPPEVERVCRIASMPAFVLFATWFFFRARSASWPRGVWTLFVVGLPAWPVAPVTISVLRQGVGMPSAGALVFLPLVLVSVRAQCLAFAMCKTGLAAWDLRRFAARLALVATSTLAFSAFFSFALAANDGARSDLVLKAYEPLAWSSFGAPFMALSVAWLAAAGWFARHGTPSLVTGTGTKTVYGSHWKAPLERKSV